MTGLSGEELLDDSDVASAKVVAAFQGASRALQMFLLAQARGSGLGLLEFLVLARAAEDEGVTPLEARRALGLRSSTMTGLADRLEGDGLIRRAPHPHDRRLLLLKATAKGRRVLERALGPLLGELDQLAGKLAPRERALVAGLLTDISTLVTDQAGTVRARRRVARASAPRRPRSDRS